MPGGRPKGSRTDPSVIIARERFEHEEYLKEIDLQMQREKLLVQLLENPRVFYTVMIGGAGALAWFQALVSKGSAKPGEDTQKWDEILKQGILGYFTFGLTGSAAAIAFDADVEGNWMDKIIGNLGKSGVALFTSLFFIHELMGGQKEGGGGLPQMLTALGATV